MAVSAAFIADFTSFTAATQKATLTLKSFESGATQVEKALNKVGNAYSGQRTLQQAVLATKAVTEIGGATKLTEKEQQRLNATLTEAIAKYGALGQQAPADMLKLEAATRKVEQSSTLTSKAMGALSSTVGQLAAGFGIATLIDRGVRSLISFGKEAVETAGRLVDLSGKTGLSLQSLQRMEFVAGQTGATLDNFADASFRLGVKLSGGSGSVKDALRDLGLSLEAIRMMPADKHFETIAAALGKVTNEAKRNELGVALMGKNFGTVAPAIAEGYDKIAAHAALMTDAQIRALERAGDDWDAFVARVKTAVGSTIGTLNLWTQELRDVIRTAQMEMRGFGDATFQWTPKAIEQFKRLRAAGVSVDEALRVVKGQIKDTQLTAEHFTGSFVAGLEKATAAARELSPEKQLELNAALKLGVESAEDLEEQFFDGTAGALKAYQEMQSGATKSTKTHATEMDAATKKAIEYTTEMYKAAAALEAHVDATRGALKDIEQQRRRSFDDLGQGEGLAEVKKLEAVSAASKKFYDEQAEAQAEAMAAGEVWAERIGTTYRTVFDDITDTTLSATGDMLAGLRSFKDGAVDIWRSLQQAVSDILNNILRNYLNQFLGKMAAANASFGGAGGGGGGGVASLFGGGGGGGASGGGGGGTAAAGGFGKFGTGAVAGGIAGLSVGYASGSKTAGALAGAGTGALTGFQFGGVYGAAIGAGVGLAGGLIGGAAGARKERMAVAQARLEWMKDAADDIRRQKGLSAGTTDTEAIQSLLGMPPGTSTAQRLWKELTLAKTLNSFSGAVGRIQNYAQGLEAERMKSWKPSTFEEAPAGSMLGQWFTGSRQGVAFHSGGMVPGTGQLNATLLGGEGVASHRGMKALAQLNAGGSPGTSQAAVDELRRLRAELAQLVRDLPRQLGVAQRSAMALAGRTA